MDHIPAICSDCGQEIEGCQAACRALGRLFHSQCFVCLSCGAQLCGRAFYEVNGKVFCEDDFKSLGLNSKTCHACGKLITTKILQAHNKDFHPSCFKCSICKMKLDGIPFTTDLDNCIYCIPDYHRRYSPRCAACSDPIMPQQNSDEILRVLTSGKTFHVECFKCEDCGQKLMSSHSETESQCYPLDGHLLCLTCNSSRLSARSPKPQHRSPSNSPCNMPHLKH